MAKGWPIYARMGTDRVHFGLLGLVAKNCKYEGYFSLLLQRQRPPFCGGKVRNDEMEMKTEEAFILLVEDPRDLGQEGTPMRRNGLIMTRLVGEAALTSGRS